MKRDRVSKMRISASLRMVFRRLGATSMVALSCVMLAPVISSDAGYAGSAAAQESKSPFVVPPGLRGRVNFWIDIFARHGRYEVVMHHRLYPQAVFARLDFRQEAEAMSDGAFERYRKDTISGLTKRVLAAVRSLASGEAPSNDFEERVARTMRSVPGNTADKYREILEDPDLIRTQTGIRERYGEAIRRAGRYLPTMERIFKQEYGLPVELTRLPFVESSFDYKAYSSVGAAGIWQFMRRTGSHYLTISKAVDERRDPVRATHAAASYLKSAFDELGSWPLAITSYNHGVAGVGRKVRMFGTTDIVQLIERPGEKPFGFASSNFYPEFLAAVEVWRRRDELFPDFVPEQPAQYRVESVGKASSVSRLTQMYGVSTDQLRELNYALTEPVWKGKLSVPAGYKLRLPIQARERAAVIEAAAPESDRGTAAEATREFSVATYRVKKGDSLAAVAKRYRVPLDQLIAANGGSEDIHIGQMLSIPRVAPTPRSMTTYTVQSGDTLHSIAKRYKLSVGKLREINKLSSTRLKVGQRLVIGE